MAGKTKRKYHGEIIKINKNLKKPIEKILEILPYNYNLNLIEEYFKKYYYYEWFYIKDMKEVYDIKDRRLESYGKKKRYNASNPKEYLLSLPQIKYKLNQKSKDKHKLSYNSNQRAKLLEELEQDSKKRYEKRYEKIKRAKEKVQQVEPEFLDKLMGLYERKNAPLNHEEKVYIFHELEKYYCVKTINFFRKHNDKEINHQLRNMAFITLQKWGHYVKLRKKNSIRISAKNKKRKEYLENIYSNLTYDIKKIPQELEYRIENNKDQKIKSYDYFISHSSLDYNEVQELIDNLNRQNKNIYCDWISDTNFLKRKLVGDATKKVIEKRMEQSKMMILLKSNNSIISNWVKYELNYFRELKKPIFQIDLIDKNNNLVEISDFSNQWFYDEEYKNINLY